MKPSATNMISQISSKSGITMAQGLQSEQPINWLIALDFCKALHLGVFFLSPSKVYWTTTLYQTWRELWGSRGARPCQRSLGSEWWRSPLFASARSPLQGNETYIHMKPIRDNYKWARRGISDRISRLITEEVTGYIVCVLLVLHLPLLFVAYSILYCFDLYCDHRQHFHWDPVELIKAAPHPCLSQTLINVSYGL